MAEIYIIKLIAIGIFGFVSYSLYDEYMIKTHWNKTFGILIDIDKEDEYFSIYTYEYNILREKYISSCKASTPLVKDFGREDEIFYDPDNYENIRCPKSFMPTILVVLLYFSSFYILVFIK